ncbi:MAG: prephenate dehydratase [Anaerolineaceae bacterium]|nr:prephenate dehydratase [Anaerolineaceae bacterium]
MIVAFQGEPGAYSEIAALAYFGEGITTEPCEGFEDIFEKVSKGQCDRGIIPIENSVAGSIYQNCDLLLQFPLEVIGEYYLQVSHCLIGLPGASLENLEKVISHPQALAQSDRFLKSLEGVKYEPVYDTAGSVKIVKEMKNPKVAAIASRRAAEIYGMDILANKIENTAANYTRFQVISRRREDPGKDAKTSIVFAMKNQAGVLYKALSVFALRDIDLTKIESRPLVGKPWDYFFYIDFAGSIFEEKVQRAMANLEEYTTYLRILGSYPRFSFRDLVLGANEGKKDEKTA